MENAHRYSPEGTHITISLNTEHDAVLAVEDEGPGIDESKCGELSKAFVRMDSRFGGIGLGLSIVSRITQLHQGHFYLQIARSQRHSRMGGIGENSVRAHPYIQKAADDQQTAHGGQTFINTGFS